MRWMQKATILYAVFVLVLSSSLLTGAQNVKAQYTPDGKGFPLASPINITSPSNSTYSSNLLLLNITFRYGLSISSTNITMVYSVDGKDNATLPVTATFVPIEVERTYADGRTEKAISSIFSYYVITGCAALPELLKGSHSITVYGKYEYADGSLFTVLDNSTVYFTIDDGIAPIISNLSVENKTYTMRGIPLNFTVDQTTFWMGYSLDGQANVTITGNTTLTELAYGSHTLTVYADDTVGNMGNSSIIDFSIAEPFPETLVATASGVTVAVVGAGLLIYFRKRNH
jgi:hypothetical protein